MPRKSTDSVASLDADSKADDASVNTRASRAKRTPAAKRTDNKAARGRGAGEPSLRASRQDHWSLAERKEKEYVDPDIGKRAPRRPLVYRSTDFEILETLVRPSRE